jgi:hypothetical protein
MGTANLANTVLFQNYRAMSLPPEKRRDRRVEFSRGFDCQMVAIDGTWCRACVMMDVAAGGARLTVTGSLEGLNLKEFFLVLSSTGIAFRRCGLAWANGDELGVHFLDTQSASKKTEPGKTK